MESYLFLLGRTPDLSVKELEACGLSTGICLGNQFYQVEFEDEARLISIFQELGGSLKLLKVVGQFAAIEEEKLSEYIAAYFAQFDRPTFAIGEINRDQLPKVQVGEVKQLLKERGISSRFIESPRDGLSASVLLHQKVEELLVIRFPEKTFFAKTLAVQNIDEWTRRDRQKPYADRKKGMLPPKVARMMVNIGLGELRMMTSEPTPASTDSSSKLAILLDPFCGSGSILIEGLCLGCEVVGCDIDQKAVAGTTANLAWLAAEYQLDGHFTVFQSDATRVSLDQLDEPVNLIVTEPFLGKQTPSEQQLANIFRGMEKLYLGAFRQWRHILTDQAVIVIIFPLVQTEKTAFSLESIIDKIQALGYTSTSDPALYHRPQAVIQRQIWTFRFNRPKEATR